MRQNYGGVPELTKERVRDALRRAADRQKEPTASGKKAKKTTKDALRKALAVSITECPPLLVDHALHVASFDSSLRPEQVLADEGLLDKLLTVLHNARKIAEDITIPDQIKGYILAKPNSGAQGNEPQGSTASKLLYDDFHPFRPQQFEDSEYRFLEFDGFNKTVDEFYSSIEGQKLETRLQERELLAKKKLENARKEHEGRIGGLQQVQELNFRKAEAIMANVHRVEEAIAAVNGLIGQKMDWVEIARLIEREQDQGNPVARLIKLPLKLYENTITLLLEESNWNEEVQDEDEGYETSSVSELSEEEDDRPTSNKKAPKAQPPTQTTLAIDVDLGMSAWQNSSEYFDQKKTAKGKEERTVLASEKVLKNQERKVAADLKKGLKQEKDILRPVRKQQWFEKFIYFISSDGYLVLGGKDAQQNEIIYRKYLRKGDIYVHADLKGAIPMVIKNNPNTPDAPIPPSTLSQAGHLSVCTSEAWDSKAVMSAWWVVADQVSKMGHGGEYLPAGLFDIKGKKEFLPPAQLIVGLASMFEISEESKARHRKHRLNDPISSATSEPMPESVDHSRSPDMAKDVGSGSDEEFPDARPASESDDDFPDTRLEDSDDTEAESEAAGHANPLQSANHVTPADVGSDEPIPEPSASESSTSKPHIVEPLNEGLVEDTGSVADSESSQKQGRRHLSAKERRLLRKGQSPLGNPMPSDSASAIDAEEDDAAISGQDGDPQVSTKGPGTVTSQASKSGKGPVPRGKRGKAKKLATKYADQDEEDRALALRLLGAQSGQKTAEAAAQEKRAKEVEAAANKQRRRDQHLRAQAAGKAAEEARRAAHEGNGQEDDAVDDEALKIQLLGLDAFTGRPLPGDEILSAIPVCAPWAALANYKYKAKMQPGAIKRGKAVKEVLTKWDNAGKDPKATDKHSQDVERIWPKEIDLIRGWKEQEVVGVVPVSKVRVMMAGGRDGGGGGGGGAKGKSKSARGGRGSKKQR